MNSNSIYRYGMYFMLIIIVIAVWYLYCYYFHSRIYINNSMTNAHLEYGTYPSSKIPNKIWSFWGGPMNAVVEKSVDSWRHYNPEYDIVLLTKDNLHRYCSTNISSLPIAVENDTRYSDYVRVNVLSEHGGIWIDASCICHQSFNWIHGIQRHTNCEYVGYYMEGNSDPNYLYRSPAIETWFFACIPNSKFMTNWKNEFMRINEFHSVDDYLDEVSSLGVSFQKYSMLNYLAINISAQYVFQNMTEFGPYSFYLMKAENTAFLPSYRNNWNDVKTIEDLKGENTHKEYHQQPMIKLMRGMRNELVQNPIGINNLFSHLTTAMN